MAALLVAFVGSGWALAVDSLTWMLSALLLTRVRLPERPRDQGPRGSMVRDLLDGWSVFTGTTWLWRVVAGFAVLNAVYAGCWLTLGPAVAAQTFGVRGWGYILSAQSVGLLLGGLAMLRLRLPRPLLAGMFGMVLFGVPILMLGLTPSVAPILVGSFLAGVGVQVFAIGWEVTMQEHIDGRVLPRASSYDSLGSFVAIPLGQLVYGPLGSVFGYRDVIVVSSAVYFAVLGLLLLCRSVRTLGRVAHVASTG